MSTLDWISRLYVSKTTKCDFAKDHFETNKATHPVKL